MIGGLVTKRADFLSRSLLAALLLITGCENDRGGRVFLIGIDGASPRVIEPLIEEGALPHLADLMRNGAYGKLRSAMPISSPRIWNSIVTGKLPAKHGILHFSKQDDQGRHRLFLSSDRKARALWSIASRRGRTVGVVNFWNTYPPEKINGVMVSDHLLAHEIQGRELMVGAAETPRGSVIYPQTWHSRLAPLVGEKNAESHYENPFAVHKTLPAWADRAELVRHFHEDQSLLRIALEIEHELHPDLLMLLLPGIDRISHFLWGVLEPEELYPPELRPSPEERAAGREALFAYYRYTDALVGEILAEADSDDLVMVLSDHGFEAGQALLRLTGLHESEKAIDGVIFVRGPGVVPGSRIENLSVNDITPTLLAWMGLPVAEDMDGRIAAFIDVVPGESIATWDEGVVEFVETAASSVEQDIVAQLRMLGYLEEEATPGSRTGNDQESEPNSRQR